MSIDKAAILRRRQQRVLQRTEEAAEAAKRAQVEAVHRNTIYNSNITDRGDREYIKSLALLHAGHYVDQNAKSRISAASRAAAARREALVEIRSGSLQSLLSAKQAAESGQADASTAILVNGILARQSSTWRDYMKKHVAQLAKHDDIDRLPGSDDDSRKPSTSARVALRQREAAQAKNGKMRAVAQVSQLAKKRMQVQERLEASQALKRDKEMRVVRRLVVRRWEGKPLTLANEQFLADRPDMVEEAVEIFRERTQMPGHPRSGLPPEIKLLCVACKRKLFASNFSTEMIRGLQEARTCRECTPARIDSDTEDSSRTTAESAGGWLPALSPRHGASQSDEHTAATAASWDEAPAGNCTNGSAAAASTDEWVQYWSEDGRPYWYNTHTGESQWCE